ncbi:zinc finger protein 84-like [Malaya genurostris]|uniref:zinc finger protein 84-like n=1 Tax=Malaya genurostris TaxID=325434 RepID=UPI0026F3B300|nr:zinc finger protein 84-like [Malaya genurostris]XP_058453725.1 zinc finger protein 84-like [Malaya genurostris]XP_058453726.1 zinc finger protein 84-like [Malaya genurostris]XP_058453727.1 zinc finger protein 84-like [Malaya genurostris]
MDIRCCLCLQSTTNDLISTSCKIFPQKQLSEILSATLESFDDENSSQKHLCTKCFRQVNQLYLLWERSKVVHLQKKCTEGLEQECYSCRICTRDDAEELIEINCLSERWNLPIDQLLLSLTGTVFKERDCLPPYICLDCLKDVEEGYGFKNRCIDGTLKSWQKMEFRPDNPNDLVIDLCAEIVPLWKVRENEKSFEMIRVEKYSCSICNLEFNLKQRKTQCDGCKLKFSNSDEIFDCPGKSKFSEIDSEDFKVEDDESEATDSEEDIEDRKDATSGKSAKRKLPDVTTLFDIVEKESESFYLKVRRKGPICCGCNEFFLTDTELEEHRKRYHSQSTGYGTFECELCLKAFAHPSILNRHKNKQKNYVYDYCERCQIILLCGPALMRHEIAVHMKQESLSQAAGRYTEKVTIFYECCVQTCRNRYSSKQQLMHHFNQTHNLIDVSSKVNTCEYCGLTFKTKYDFLVHANRRIDCVRYQCTIENCKFAVSNLSGIVWHCTEKRHKRVGPTKRWKKNIPDLKHFELVGTIDDVTDILQRKSEACCGCSQFFEQVDDLKNHCKEIHQPVEDEHPYRCPHCARGFESEFGLSTHLYTAANRTHYYCRPCKMFMWKKPDLNFHKARYHTDDQRVEVEGQYETELENCFTCCGCDEQFHTQQELTQHRTSKHQLDVERKPKYHKLRCSQCNKYLASSEKLKQHQEMYESRKIYSCKELSCVFRTRDISSMVHHLSASNHRTADGRKFYTAKGQLEVYRCCGFLCDFTSTSYENIIEHGCDTHTEKRERNWNCYEDNALHCPVCLKGFDDPAKLANHQFSKMKLKSDQRCRICKKIISKDEFNKHLENCSKHVNPTNHATNDRPKAKPTKKVCSICGKSLSVSGMFNHMLAHENKRAWKCTLCPMRFNNETMLRNHATVHSDERLFQCRHGCENRYKNAIDRTRHENFVHLGIRPFSCRTCSKSFVRNRDLQLHERRHTGKQLYECDTCSESFNKLSQLKLHKEQCSKDEG